MRSLISLFLASLILVFNMGLHIDTHYCCGVEVESRLSLSIVKNQLDCETIDKLSNCNHSSSISSLPCCENEYSLLEINDLNNSKILLEFESADFLIQSKNSFIASPTVDVVQDDKQYSAPILVQDKWVIFQNFLI